MCKVRAAFDRNELKCNSLDNLLCKSLNASPNCRYWSSVTRMGVQTVRNYCPTMNYSDLLRLGTPETEA